MFAAFHVMISYSVSTNSDARRFTKVFNSTVHWFLVWSYHVHNISRNQHSIIYVLWRNIFVYTYLQSVFT